MNVWSKSAFILVGAILLTLGVRNLLWTVARQRDRFTGLVSRGPAPSLFAESFWLVLLGGLVAFAARDVPHSTSWQLLGGAILMLGCAGLLVARFGSLEAHKSDQVPPEPVLLKRVRGRRLSGMLYIFGGAYWIWNGMSVFNG